MDVGLCQPSNTILLVATAGVIYHLLAGNTAAMLWWIVVGVAGTGVFQGLCYGGLEPVAWVLMAIPVLVICFFLAVALFASRMRIENIAEVPCHSRCPACGGNGCSQCQSVENFENQAAVTMTGCPYCSGRGCPYCAYKSAEIADALKIPAGVEQFQVQKINKENGVPCSYCKGHGCKFCRGGGCQYCRGGPGSCPKCPLRTNEGFHDGPCAYCQGSGCPRCRWQSGIQACASCGGAGCPYCAYEASLCRDCQGRGCASCNREIALSTY